MMPFQDGIVSLTCSSSWMFLLEPSSPERIAVGGGGVTLQHHAGYHGAGRVEKAWPRGSDSRGQNPPKEARESDLWFPNVTDAGDGSLILGLKQAQG